MESAELSLLNPRPERLPGPGLLHHLVNPPCDSLALEYLSNNRRTSHSYRDLHDAADVVAAQISLARGEIRGQFVVPVLVHQSPQLYIALLAILKAGGAFCPLNVDAPPERVSFILSDVSATVVVASEELAPLIPPQSAVKVLLIDRQDSSPDLGAVEHRAPSPNDLAYVMYTSGSTGTPKGVGISHSAAAQALLAHDRHVPSFSRFLQFAAPTFDVSVFEIFFPLFRGCTLISVSRREMLNDLPAVLLEMNVDACELTPTVAASLLRRRENAPTLRLLLTIGEMLNVSVVQEFGGDGERQSLLWAMYGPTEATIHCTVQEAFSSESTTHNIGVPLDTVSCFVIEPASSPQTSSEFKILPRGEVGELAVGGHQLAEGYLNRPEQTSSSFITSPYGRVYRTGDKARLNSDGTLQCLGRLSEGQVKLRGQRLELGEVEAAVLRTPGCHGAAAAVLDSILVVFCAVDAQVAEDSIMTHCKRWLPQFMVPGELVMMQEFPRLPSGKVDKKRLKAEFQDQKAAAVDDGVVSAALSDTEKRVLGVVSEVLDMEVNTRVTLASAGVDSLVAIKLASSLRAAGFEASAAGLLSLKTVSDLCATAQLRTEVTPSQPETADLSLLADLDQMSASNAALQSVVGLVEDVLPCSPLQTAMLAETVRHPEAYWNEVELEAAAGVTADGILSAINELARRNEVLRAGFIQWRDGFASPVFKTLHREQVTIVDVLQELNASGPDSLLRPFHVQIKDGGSANGARILIHIHHAVYDGWSMDIILSDLSALLRGTPLPSREQYRNVVKHCGDISTSQSDSSRAFWTEHLLGWNKPPFPKLSARPAEVDQIMVKREQLDVPVKVVEEGARQTGCTPESYFQASLALLWSSILGTSDVVIGSVSSGRTVPVDGIEGIVGPCIASVPLRVDVNSAVAVSDLLMSIKSRNRSIMEHCTLPLSEIKKLTGLQTAESLYDVLFVYQESLYSARRIEGLFNEARHLDRLETKLLLEVEPQNHGFALQATYHSGSFPPEVVDRSLQQIKEIFQQVLSRPEESIQSTMGSIIGSEPSVYNDHPETETLQDGADLAALFETAAARSPQADAICFSTSLAMTSMTGTTMSYETLNKYSNQIANFLLDQGAEPGHVIAIIMEKSPLLYASILGIVKARCAYLPLLPSTPVSRVQDILQSGNIQRCLIDTMSSSTFGQLKDVQFLNIESCPLDSCSDRNLDIPIDLSRLAYVIYTSGTTGVPKGVAVTQKNIVRNVTHLASIYPVAQRSAPRLLQACSQAFDVSVFEIFFTWYAGMCLCAARNDDLFEDLEHGIRQLQITHLSLTPTVASLIDPNNVPSVEFLVTAGEPITASVLDKWGELLWQGYGPSETTNICSVKRMKHGEHIEHLGWVFPNTSVFVLAPGSLATLPTGWVGEFCFGGDQVADGYLNMPTLTADKFIKHSKFGRIYRSGDMGRMLPDGSLIILGRIDDQLKLRGQRIEAGEVSSVMTGCTALVNAAVTTLVRRGSGAPDQLASFYVCPNVEDEFKTLEVDLETHRLLLANLQSRLSSYMIPSYLIPVSRIPLTSSGKVDRRRFQSCFEGLSRDYVEAVSSTTVNQDEAEWTETEATVADIIAKSLDISRSEIDRWTSFASLGLDSISAIGVAREMSSQLTSRVAISAILQNPTVAQLSRFIDQTPTHSQQQSQAILIAESLVQEVRKAFQEGPHEVAEVLPCSPLQEAMLSSGQGSYFNKILLRVHVQPELMMRCWDEMNKRHGILRTCFVTTGDAKFPIVQVVLDNWSIPWRAFNVDEPSLDGAIHEHLQSLPDPLDTKTPPISLAMIRYKGLAFLSLICHHALYDGVAMENLWREVEAFANGNELPPVVPYEPFLRESLALPGDADKFWMNHFRGFSPPGLFVQPARRQIEQCLHTTSFDMPFGELQDRNRSLGVSLLSLCQAAWANVLAVSSKHSDVCFGCVMSGRTLAIEGLDRLVAPCFNTVPVRKDIAPGLQNIELVKSFQRLNSDLLRYQFTPLRMVQRLTGNQGRKLFDSLLLLQRPLQNMDTGIWTLEEDSGDMDIPIVCEVVPCPALNSVVVNLYYDMAVVGEDIAVALADIFKHFLRLMLGSPSTVLADRSSLPAAVLPLLDTMAARRNRSKITSQAQLKDEKWTEAETLVQDILSKLSGVPRQKIYRNTSIFQLGLDSINAVQVASMLRRQGLAVSASDVVECQNCAKLAERMLTIPTGDDNVVLGPTYDLDKIATEVSSQVRSELPHDVDIEAILPCTPMQSAMLASFGQSQGKNYLNLVSYAIDGTVSKEDLVNAWTSLQRRHPMLRTGFLAVQHHDSVFSMVRHSAGSETLGSINIAHGIEQASNLPQWKKDVAANILDVPYLPPWRVALVPSGDDDGLLMHLLIHHALYDAQSLDAMLANLSMSLRGEATQTFSPVEPGLKAILAEGLDRQTDSQKFWAAKADMAVVNSFPIMTSLRELERAILSHSTESSLSLALLQDAIQKQGVSIQAVIQAAWTRVLSSYLGEESVVFGVTLSGRTMDETRDAPFPCMTTIPIVTSNRSSNTELVSSMMDYNASVHKHQFSPLSQIQKWLGHPATPVFDTLLVYQKLEKSQSLSRPWNLINDDAAVDYPVSLEVEATDNDKIRLCITFFSDVLPKEQAALLVQQFDAMMIHIATQPDGNEDGIYAERPDLFAMTPPVSPELPAPVHFLHQFVEARASSHPDTIALEFVGRFDGEVPIKQTWTYSELDAIGNKVANMLSGVAAVGSIVAIHFDKCPEAYFSILGILKAGCAFVALDPSAPKTRKQFIMSDSLAPCLLTSAQSSLDFDVAAEIIRIDVEALQRYSPDRRDLGSDFTPEATCYCLYTSGTTGTPKGCEITHENSVQAMMAFQELFKGHWSDDSRWLQFAALHFDVSVLEQYWSWSVGITVVAAPRDLILDDLIAAINRLEITHIDLTPSLARLTHPDEVPGLCKGVFITGGEQLKQEILDAWGPKAVIYNAYGPTEATIGVTMYQRMPINGRPSNIGRQFLNVGSYVFRRGTEIPVLRGAVGELCVSGKLVGKGYLNRPELTEERFPTLSEFGERIYRTGDLVRILHDGCFDFLGRADDQVKLRGQRLEIGEINHVIRTGAPEVQDAATIVIRHGSSGKDVLVSFLVGQKTSRGTLTLLQDDSDLGVKARAACRERLPGYMIPTYFLVLPYIPLSPNNKVEAKELKQLFNSLSYEQLLSSTAVKASTREVDSATGQKIISVLAKFSRVQEEIITEDTSIFDLGVDSITALQLSTVFKNRGFAACSPAVLLRNPIVADLAVALCDEASSASKDKLVRESKQVIQACHHRHHAFVCRALNVQPKDIEYIAPCSSLQQGIISRSMTDAVRGTYFNSFELLLDVNTSVERVQRAWRDLVASQAILRTAFVKTTDGYIQVALRDPAFPWRENTLDNNEDVNELLEAEKQAWIQRNNDHITVPIKLVLVRSPNSRKLVVHIFHGLYDGNSFDLMVRRVRAMYDNNAVPEAPSYLEALSHGPLWRHDDCRQFWESHLHGWEPPSVLQLSSSPGDKAASATKIIPGTILQDARKRHNVTLQSVVLALWTSVLQPHFSSGLTLGLIVAGRAINLPNVENTIGPLFNTVPFFNQTLQYHTWSSLIHKCHEFSTSTLQFQHVPLKSIQKWCSSGRPLFDNLFVFELERDVPTNEPDLWTIEDGVLNPDYPLALEAKRMQNGDLKLSLVAQGHVANEAKLQEMLDQMEENAASILAGGALQGSEAQSMHLDKSPMEIHELADRDNIAAAVLPFEWTDQAKSIRDVIAALTDIPVEDITATKTMLELGLDSIDVIQLSAQLRQKGMHISASQIMRQQTVAQMVREMETQQPISARDTSSDTLLQAIERQLWTYVEKTGLNMEEVETVLPLTPLQESMVAGMVHSDFEWYFNHDLLEVAAAVDLSRLREAWFRVIDQSPILRTGFLEVDDRKLEVGYCQVIYKRWTSAIEETQVSSLSEVQPLIEHSKQKARDMHAADGLFQLKLVSCGERNFVFVSIAHALYDGWSLDLMYRDLETAYNNGEPRAKLSERPFLRKMLASKTDDAGRFWAGYLDGVSPTILPERHELASAGAALYRREAASAKTMSQVSDFCKKQSISLQVLCQACWAMVLAHRTRTLDVTFGVVLSGRDFEGAEDLMFPTINTVALRCILHGTSSAFLKYLEASMTDIRDYQAYPLRKIQASAELSGTELFNSLFMLQKSPNRASPDRLLESVDGLAAVDYPVCIEAEGVGADLIWRAACQSRLFSEEETGELIRDLDNALGFMMDSATSDVLSFQDHGVSVCGLSLIRITDSTETASADATEVSSSTDDEQRVETALRIRQILSYVSDIPTESIPEDSSLYRLGLDSISAIKVSSLLRKEGLYINPRDLIKATSIAHMARLATQLSQSRGQEPPETLMPWIPGPDVDVDGLLAKQGISRKDVEAVLPALPMQVYMISAWQNAAGSVFFPEFRYSVDGISEMERVDAAWRSLVAQTPILRTCFLATNSMEQPFLQVILKPERTAANEPAIQPLVQFSVSKHDKIKRVMIRLKIHHALYDGVSLPEILNKLAALLAENTVAVEQDGIQHWSKYTIRPSLGEARQARRAFWTDYLHGCPIPNAQEPTWTSGSRVSYLKRPAVSNVARLQLAAAQHGISIQALFFAAYAKALIANMGATNDSASDTAVFGIYLANRASDERLPPSFPTLNLVPLRVRAAVGDQLLNVAAAIQSDIHRISSDDFADVGLWEIAAWTGVRISSFVNFLSLPEGDAETSASPEGGVRLIRAAQENEAEADPATESTTREWGFAAHPWVQNNVVRDAFPAAIDVEASIKGRSLDIGVFGSRQCTSDDEAFGLVTQLVSHLYEVAGSSGTCCYL